MERASEYLIRPPRVADVAELGALHCRVWQEAYAGLMDEESFAALTPERFARGWGRRMEQMDADGFHPNGEQVAVAEHAGELVAFISVGPPREDDAPVETQLWSINVAAEHHGTGVAQRLLDDVLGERDAYLWVADGNDRAIRFYERNGFRLDGTSTDRADGMREVRMTRR